MQVSIAHIGEFAADSQALSIVVGVGLLFVLALSVEHFHVKNGGVTSRQVKRVVMAVAALVLGASIAPSTGFAQTTGEARGLPDLISDPPFNWRTEDVRTPQGEVIRVLAFDGYIHNIGTGKLQVSGNPQLEEGMQQQVFDGQEWSNVTAPTVRFETDDGHNHFHLIRAVDYALWSDDRSVQVTDASKVGFCLVDTEQIEEGYESNYLIEDFNYCGVDDPESTDLTMGITPGWRDTYDANVTMQWVDISDVTPGMYWTSAETDPNNEIVESNEDNNAIVFSQNRYAVDGYVARDLGPQTSGDIRLKANTYGTVGERAWVIAEAPANGTLDVPADVDLIDIDTVRYTPDADFVGTDTFSYYAHDIATPFPHTPALVEVAVVVDEADASEPTLDSTSNIDEITISDPGPQAARLYDAVEVSFTADFDANETRAARWYSQDLPSGLSIDVDTGTVTGIPTFAATFDSTIVSWLDGERVERTVQWDVADQQPPSLAPTGSFSTPGSTLLRRVVGAGTAGATYSGEGLPDGGSIVANSPMVTGYVQDMGTFRVQVEELVDDQVVGSIEFDWTVRPSTRPAFPL